MSPRSLACTAEKQPNFFQIPAESSRCYFYQFAPAFIFGKLGDVFTYKRSLVITEAVCCDIFSESFCNGGNCKIPRRVTYTNLSQDSYYCACAPADIFP